MVRAFVPTRDIPPYFLSGQEVSRTGDQTHSSSESEDLELQKPHTQFSCTGVYGAQTNNSYDILSFILTAGHKR